MSYFLDNIFLFCIIILGLYALIIFLRIFRFIYYFIRCFYLSYKYRSKYDDETQKILSGKKYSRPDSPLERNREDELQLKEDLKRLRGATDLADVSKKSDIQIVGIAEPIGIWTKFVTKQKLSWLKAMVGSKAENDRFWQNIVKAQEQAQGKQKGRNR